MSEEFPELRNPQDLNALAAERSWPLCADGLGNFYLPETEAVHALWRNKAGENEIPHRSEITARLLKPYLKIVNIHERVWKGSTRRYRLRLMGSAVAEMLGEASGKYYDEFLPPDVLGMWNAMSDVVLAYRKPIRFLVRADRFAKAKMSGEIFAAPLLTADGRADMAISAGRFNKAWDWEELSAQWRQDLQNHT